MKIKGNRKRKGTPSHRRRRPGEATDGLRTATQEMIEKIREKEAKLVEPEGGYAKDMDLPKDLAIKLTKAKEENQLLVNYLVEAGSLLKKFLAHFERQTKNLQLERIISIGLLHDLKNIMTIIDSSAQFCLADVSQESPLHENLSIILEKTRLATEIMERFSDYRKTLSRHYHPVDVGKLIRDTWRLMQHTFPAGRISFQADFEDNLPRVLGNHENLQRVFFNLFLNAIQAIGKKGKIIVEVRLTAFREMVEINIIDNGAGIPAEIIGKIFVPYFTTKKEGDGLGLHICGLILREHKGTINIESADKAGTKVTVRIPAMKKDSERKNVEELFEQGEEENE